ncbi:hypothetical protein BGZ95_005712 [Linnemannia exigua]|uniref:Uncharacterized protein n=1 Tax=Linnemannia exigua TaxID=604196 RepID=A0AAD4DGI7_9FUNG|nr:hypothetical protein BGZ95_005712 [Linnemannia exigua]
MKISFVLSALVAMAATTVSAAPSSSPLRSDKVFTLSPEPNFIYECSMILLLETNSARAEPCTPTSLFWNRVYKVDGNHRDPERDLHSFELVVRSKYHGTLSLKKTKGDESDNYEETRTSDDGKWKVKHTDEWNRERVTLTVKGKKHVFDNANGYSYGMKDWRIEYWTCVEW